MNDECASFRALIANISNVEVKFLQVPKTSMSTKYERTMTSNHRITLTNLTQNFDAGYGTKDNNNNNKNKKAGGGGYSLIWVIRVRAAGQGMVFWPCCPKPGIHFDLPLS